MLHHRLRVPQVGPTSMTFITSVYGGSFPPDVRAGDLLVVAQGFQTTSGVVPPWVLPTDFTNIANASFDGSTDMTIGMAYKVAVGGESGSWGGMTTAYKQILQLRGNVPARSCVVGSAAAQVTDADIPAQIVAAGAARAPLLVVAAYGFYSPMTGYTTYTGATPTYISVTNFLVAYTVMNSSPANVTVDMTDPGVRNGLASCYLEMR